MNESLHWAEWFEAVVTERIGANLPKKTAALVRFLAANPDALAFSSAAQVARRAGVNPATVVRLAQALGMKGYTELQQHLRHQYFGMLLPLQLADFQQSEWSSSNPLDAMIQQDMRNLEALRTSATAELIVPAAQMIHNARRTVVITSGTYAAPGILLAHQGQYMGRDIVIEERAGMHLVNVISNLRPEDCVVVSSFWHLIRHHVLALKAAKRRGIPTIALTDSKLSVLAKEADLALIVPTQSISFFQSMTAAMTATYAIVAHLKILGGDAALQAMKRAEEAFPELEAIYD